jgi:hypothetical protein
MCLQAHRNIPKRVHSVSELVTVITTLQIKANLHLINLLWRNSKQPVRHCYAHWVQNTGLFEMIVGVLTNCHTQYTWDRSICIFLFNRTTLQVFVTYLTGALYVHSLWFYKHQHDNRVRSKLSVACQRWWFQWRFWFVPSVPGYLREGEEHKPDPWRNPTERTTYSYLKCIVHDKLLKLRQSFLITLYMKNILVYCKLVLRWCEVPAGKRNITEHLNLHHLHRMNFKLPKNTAYFRRSYFMNSASACTGDNLQPKILLTAKTNLPKSKKKKLCVLVPSVDGCRIRKRGVIM